MSDNNDITSNNKNSKDIKNKIEKIN